VLAVAIALMACRGSRAKRDDPPGGDGGPPRAGTVADGDDLKTWWHPNGELNSATPVAPGNVRRSTVYDVEVATRSAPDVHYDSFVYMTVPRSGRAKIGYLDNDGAEFADEADLTMSWSSFLYGADVWVQVDVKEGPPVTSAREVTIRPTTLDFQKERVSDRSIRILVPYSDRGYRFSVELDSQQLTSYRGPGGGLTIHGRGLRAVHTEPRNALLIFASPIPKGEEARRLVPDPSAQSVHYPPGGETLALDQVTSEVIHFRPGTYYLGDTHHAYLRPEVKWVYLAPGAYVKGAFQFRPGQKELRVTGFGVLSGEQYTYEPDRANGYHHRAEGSADCHTTCLKMLEFEAGLEPQQLVLHGITLAEPPYHTFVVYGHDRGFRMEVSQFKQVGGWYWQTDGLELYPGSALTSSFFHANDDVLKLYASNLTVNDIVVWKPENGPVIQWGWAPRNIDGVHVDGVDVIHNRMYLSSHNSCIINSARQYLDPLSGNLADPTSWVKNLLLENIRSEGMNLCAMRLYALSSWERIHIKNLWIERWNELGVSDQASQFQALQNEQGIRVIIGNETREGRGLELENYQVGGERIGKSAGNWQSDRPGRLDFDPSLWESWNAW
jgi:hypothetical protein